MTFLQILVVALSAALTSASSIPRNSLSYTSSCPNPPSILHLADPPQDNYLYSDCQSSAHVIITSPSAGSTQAKPRLIVAWPSGNSGILALFAPEHSQDGTLNIKLLNTSNGRPLDGIYDGNYVGVSGVVNFNIGARLTVPIEGSIRTIRDFTEGGVMDQDFQDSFGFGLGGDGSASINRTWFDGVTTSRLGFMPLNGASAVSSFISHCAFSFPSSNSHDTCGQLMKML